MQVGLNVLELATARKQKHSFLILTLSFINGAMLVLQEADYVWQRVSLGFIRITAGQLLSEATSECKRG